MVKLINSDEILKMVAGLLHSDYPAVPDAGGGENNESDGRLSENVSLMAEDTVNRIIRDSDSYSYDVNEDPLYKQYRDMYEEEGSLAAEDLMGKASSLTGGYGNSYGSVIASDAKRKYSEMSADKAAELEEKAYKRHQDSLSNLYSVYNLLTDFEKSEADKKKAALDFAVTAANMGDTSFVEALGIDPSDSDFKKLQERAEFLAKYGDYSALEALGVDTSSLKAEKELEKAEIFAKYGDYSALSNYGVNTTSYHNDRFLEFGKTLAEYGDYSVLEMLGLDTAAIRKEKQQEKAELFAKYGDYSGLKGLGIDVSGLSEEEKREVADFYAKYGDYSLLSDAGVDISKLQAQERRDFFEYYMKLGMDIGDFYAKYGDYSGLEMLGIDTSKLDKDAQLELAQLYAKYGDYSLLKKLGVNTSDRETEEYYDRLIKRAKVW